MCKNCEEFWNVAFSKLLQEIFDFRNDILFADIHCPPKKAKKFQKSCVSLGEECRNYTLKAERSEATEKSYDCYGNLIALLWHSYHRSMSGSINFIFVDPLLASSILFS